MSNENPFADMEVDWENVDKAKFQAALGPVYVDFGKRFGQANIDRIKNYR